MSANINSVKNVENILRSINKSWSEGRSQDLAHYFHDDMIIQGPGLQDTIKGQHNCIKHYEGFASHSNFKDFKSSDYTVNVWDNTAIASYRFDIEFEADGEIRKESGHELYSFLREDDEWKAVWNTIMPFTSKAC